MTYFFLTRNLSQLVTISRFLRVIWFSHQELRCGPKKKTWADPVLWKINEATLKDMVKSENTFVLFWTQWVNPCFLVLQETTIQQTFSLFYIGGLLPKDFTNIPFYCTSSTERAKYTTVSHRYLKKQMESRRRSGHFELFKLSTGGFYRFFRLPLVNNELLRTPDFFCWVIKNTL